MELVLDPIGKSPEVRVAFMSDRYVSFEQQDGKNPQLQLVMVRKEHLPELVKFLTAVVESDERSLAYS